MALGNLIKSWENIMRDDDGVSGTVQVLSQLVWMLFLKVYDLKEDEWELYEDDFESAIPENCRWRNWARGKTQKDKITGDELVDFVNNTLFPTLKELPVTSQSSKRRTIVKEMMAESYNYMKDGVCIRKAVDLLDGINFDDQEEHHSFNMIYETLLRGLQSAGRSGEFYTPRALTQLITEKVNPELGKVTADPCCGSGGMFVQSARFVQVHSNERGVVSVYGQEFNADTWKMAKMNMAIRGIEADLGPYQADTFSAFQNGTLEDVKGFCAVATTQDIAKQDYILTPGRYVGIEEQEDDGEPFEEKMTRLTSELSEMFAKSHELEDEIRKKLGAIGYEI
ncbi:MAG: N-6 DNA methylase [Lachnospiraceae bacterium]|nr:N-6 DNA methylase [Lachnospiraceae bacterium]